MQLTLLKGYPDLIGRRLAFVGYGTGPASYSQTTADPVTIPAFQNYIDFVQGDLTVSGTYYVRATPAAVGARASWKLRWYVTSTNAEVGNGVNLSGESVQIGGFGGRY
jgi:hypothetical protein